MGLFSIFVSVFVNLITNIFSILGLTITPQLDAGIQELLRTTDLPRGMIIAKWMLRDAENTVPSFQLIAFNHRNHGNTLAVVAIAVVLHY